MAGSRRRRALRLSAAVLGLAPALLPGVGAPQPVTDSYTLYGTPGSLLEMPSAESAADAELAGSYAKVGEQTRSTLTFQITPRLSGSFRYAYLPDYELDGRDRYDRSFDLRFRLLDEGAYLPAVAIGLQDFIGTGVYSSEYIVATKTLGPVTVTGGLGWGRLGSRGDLGTPFGDRPEETEETGGTANFDHFFRGPVAPFGGVSWRATDRLTLKAEYSSDDYAYEVDRGIFEESSPWNFGAEYRIGPDTRLQVAYLHGEEVAAQLTFALDPKTPASGPANEPAPLPVAPRPSRAADPEAYSTDWVADAAGQATFRTRLTDVLDEEGIALEAIALRATAAEVRIVNRRYGATAQAVGRTARVLTRALPDSIETITIVPVTDGVPDAAISFRRTDLERLENAPGAAILDRARITSAAPDSPDLVYRPGTYPAFDWSIRPYVNFSLFDPDDPLRADLGLRFAASYEPAPGWIVAGSVAKRVVGNRDDITRETESELPRVRTDFPSYIREGDPAVEALTLAWYDRPGRDLYSRVTVGYLERMYAGLSSEVLWKPAESRLGLGAEVNYVRQRDFDGMFGLRDYDVWTGHASAYYDFENGFHAQVDVGRYLAGDYGATLSLDREFANGWEVGAYATLTDVPFEEFGEGSFDKGIRLTVPLSWFSGQPTRQTYSTTIRPITRDGGARLRVGGRLYERVRDSHAPALDESSGRFWR